MTTSPRSRHASSSYLRTGCIIGSVLVSVGLAAEKPGYPVTDKRPITDEYWGVTVTEDYRWLENGQDPEVKDWIAAQNELTFSIIDTSSNHEGIHAEMERLFKQKGSSFSSLVGRHGVLFAIKSQPPKQQSFLVTLGSVMDTATARTIVDPNEIDTSGHTTINWYVPSVDGTLVAVCLSSMGSELGTVHVYDVATGEALADTVPRVNGPTAGGGLCWNADGTGFHYTRYPHEGERPDADLAFYQQVYFHTLGTPYTQDRYELGKDFPRIAEIDLKASHDGKHALATVSNGDGGEYMHFVCTAGADWTQLTKFSDRITTAVLGLDNALYLLSLKDAPHGQILRMPLDARTELANTTVFVAEGEGVITAFEPTAQKLYVEELMGGPSRIRVFNCDGREENPVPTSPVVGIGAMHWTEGDKILFSQTSYLAPSAYYQYEPAEGTLTPTALRAASRADWSGAEVVREFAISKDGTRVPINIIRPKGLTLDGSHPTILYGYGGYGNSMTPSSNDAVSMWVSNGGVYAVANIRGGGEFGDEWHLAGNLTKKQNVFDDFIACAEYLIKAGYTNPSKLGTAGGSNGGLLMGAILTQRPELLRAVVSSVGLYDMLRVELHPNGAYNVTEFGTVNDKAQFEALYAYSPYHHVTDGTAYPAVLFTTGKNDGRVDPANSRKMAARMQAATSSVNPILLRTSSTTGHGSGTALDEYVEQATDYWVFFFDQLGVKYKGAAGSQ